MSDDPIAGHERRLERRRAYDEACHCAFHLLRARGNSCNPSDAAAAAFAGCLGPEDARELAAAILKSVGFVADDEGEPF
jgi:hypothetical protein